MDAENFGGWNLFKVIMHANEVVSNFSNLVNISFYPDKFEQKKFCPKVGTFKIPIAQKLNNFSK